MLDNEGAAPDLDPGETEVTDDGNPVDVEVEVIDDEEVGRRESKQTSLVALVGTRRAQLREQIVSGDVED